MSSEQENKQPNLDNPPFYLTIVEGRFSPENINVELVDDTLNRNEESEKYIEDRWTEYKGEKRPGDEKPSRYRLVDSMMTREKLQIHLDPSISYKDYIGSRTQDFVNLFGKEYSAYPLAVTFMLETSDNSLILTYRLPFHHDYKPGGLHAGAAGFIIHKDAEKDGKPNPTRSAIREAREEFGIKQDEISEISCLGIIEDPITTHPDILFRGRTYLSSEKALARTVDGENRLLAIDYTPESVKDWTLALSHALVPPAVAALVFDGRYRFGESWFKEISEGLDLRSKAFCDPILWKAYERRDLARARRRLTEQQVLK